MSRFAAKNINGEKFSYGFDRPLQEFFLQHDELELDLVGFGSFPHVAGTNGNFLNAVEKHGIILPEKHRMEVAFDLPFSD